MASPMAEELGRALAPESMEIEEEEAPVDDLEVAAQELIDAIAAGDPALVAAALRSAVALAGEPELGPMGPELDDEV